MSSPVRRLAAGILPVALWVALVAADPREPVLVDFAAPGAIDRIQPNGAAGVAYALVDAPRGKAVEVTCTPADNAYPGTAFDPAAGPWDLSSRGRVEAVVTNLSAGRLTVCLRVDNDGDWRANPWNAENLTLDAGQTGTVQVTFGWSFGNRGFRLDPSRVARLLVFTTKPAEQVRFRVEAIRAAGQPGDLPAQIAGGLKPAGGRLLDLDGRIEGHGAAVNLVGEGAARHVRVAFSANERTARPGVIFHAPEGRLWNLSAYTQAEVTVRNPGDRPIRLVGRVENRWANGWPGEEPTNCTVTETTVAAGARASLVLPFWTGRVWDGADKASGERLVSDTVAAVSLWTDKPAADCAIEVLDITAKVGPPPVLPDWLGQRPPVPGDWRPTLADDFTAPTLNADLWALPEKPWASYWGNSSNNCPDLAYVEDGCLVIRAERRDFSADADEKVRQRQYATSVVTTFDKWTQHYGYFEARMKCPTTLGLWPAFWMMPDRGREAGPEQWRREDTHNGGMEIDIMEALARFGPFRYNVAMHWDGYGDDHQSIGTERVYAQPDADGWIVSGLLWEPGKLTLFANGQEVGHWQNERIASVPAYLLFTLPTGGWGTFGYVDDDRLPATFQIDWVRCWQRDDLR